MRVSFNSNISKSANLYSNRKITRPNINLSIEDNDYYNVSFLAAPITKPVISTKIYNEKSRMLKRLDEILKTNVPHLNEDQLWEIIERRATGILRMKNRKKISFELELDAMYNTPYMSSQQKYNRLCEIEREEKELDKIDPFAIPDYILPKETKETYDYKLIEKFRLALNDNNFDLRTIFQGHYTELNEMSTVEEIKEKYPSLKIPPSFDEVLADKIIKTVPRDAYIELYEAVKSNDDDKINKLMLAHFLDKSLIIVDELGLDEYNYIPKFMATLAKRFAKVCARAVKENRLNTIPTIVKSYIPELTEADKLMSQINYDKFVLYVLKEHYLNGKKLNEIAYAEGDRTVRLTDLKGSEYKFEKFSENIKKFITDSEKLKQYQRDYLKFTSQELKDRLLHYEKTELGYDDELFNLFAEFESCKFTQEDKNNLIILLKELDKISDGLKTLDEAKNFLKTSNIKPHGTNKINETAKEEARALIRAQQKRNQILINIRNDFNITVNKLYEMGLISEADMCMKYYPLNPETAELTKSEEVIKFIKDCVDNYDKKTAQTKIARWETYNDYIENAQNSTEFRDAKIFVQNTKPDLVSDTIGQYLINRNIVDGYPESIKLFSDPELLDDIITQAGKNKDLATRLLCRYENYKQLPIEEKSSVFKIIELFNEDKALDKTILKYIIENDYINCDTAIIVERENKPQKRTIASKAKHEILEKYNFPGSIEFFKKFENALPLDARNESSSGVKKTDKYDKKMEIKYELKIMGHNDRLFACNKDFYFDSFSEIGFH